MWRICLLILPLPALACDRPVCAVDPMELELEREITFDDLPSSAGPGRAVNDVLALPGAAFGERFAGQSVEADGNFDRVIGQPLAPLALLPGDPARNVAILRLYATNVLSPTGPMGYPRHEATGEGALAILFERPQSALRFDLRGGEGGTATVVFLDPSGAEIDRHDISALSEHSYGFERVDGRADIAGLLVTNADPDGIALDTLAFDPPPFGS